MTTELRISDASCGHCKQTIETAVSSLPDVTGADLDLDKNLLTVQHGGELEVEQLTRAIRDVGYTPELVA